MGEIVTALQRISKSKLDVDLLYQEVMRIEGFEEEFLGSTFDHLVECENLAKGFLAKNGRLKRIWLEKFKESNWSDISHPWRNVPLSPFFLSLDKQNDNIISTL